MILISKFSLGNFIFLNYIIFFIVNLIFLIYLGKLFYVNNKIKYYWLNEKLEIINHINLVIRLVLI